MLILCIKEDWTCWICGGAVDIDWEVGSPSAPSKDHVVPRSVMRKNREEYTVEFLIENIRLAHRYCNSERKSTEVNPEEAESYREKLKKAEERWDKKMGHGS